MEVNLDKWLFSDLVK